MRKLLLIVINCVLFLTAYSQDSLNHIAELQLLLKERNARFSMYDNSMEQHSGIFGNKTKKDLEKSRAILLDIVNTDKKIFDKLGQVISERGMAKADYSVDEMQNKQTVANLAAAADTLNVQLDSSKRVNVALAKKVNAQQLIIYFLLAALATLLLLFFRARFSKR